MSYTTVLKVAENKAPETLRELRNSHGSAPVVWNAMCQKYLGTKDHSYMFDGTLDSLWPLYKDLIIPRHHRAVLMMTYDRAYISSSNYSQAAKDIRLFLSDFPVKEDYVNHWPEIAEIYESNPDSEAIGLYCTSVSDNPFEGEYNEEAEDYDPIDWNDAFEIYDELNAIDGDEVRI